MGRITSWSYDVLGRPLSVSNPAIQASPLVAQAFTLNGQRASLTDANSNVTTYTWDGFDRLAATSWPDSSYETLGYDADSNVVSRGTRAGQAIAYAYDGLNRLVTKTPPAPWPVVSYAYDLAGRVTSVSDTSAAIQPIATPASTTVYTTSTTYDALNRPTGVVWDPAPASGTPPAAGPVVTFGHSYNKANQRTGQSVSDNGWIDYPAATPATTAYTANALNQYTAVGGVTPSYDTDGNLTSDGTYTLGYDPESRLTSASGAGNTAAYAFDAQDRRKSRTVNGTATITVTDADNREVLEYDGASGTLLRWYAYGLGPNDLLNQMNVAAGTRATLLPDLLGSIIGSIDSATGALTKFGYRPFGASPAAPAAFGFTGQRIDAEAGGLYHYRARHYSPVLGRFLQPDPIGFAGGPHLYGYVGNDPLNLVDPMGLAATRAAAQIAQQVARQQIAAQQAVARATNTTRRQQSTSEVPAQSQLTSTAMAQGIAPTEEPPRGGDADEAKPTSQENVYLVAGPADRLQAHPGATGPHSSFRYSPQGRIQNYQTYEWNPATQTWVPTLRFRGEGKPHGGVQPPFILEPKPGSGIGSRPIVPRPALPWEIPGSGSSYYPLFE